MPQSPFEAALADHQRVFAALGSVQGAVERIAQRLADALRAGGKIMLCGNGGSAADSQHIAAELSGRFVKDRAPLAGLALSTDSSALTCIGNDYGFEAIFERQLRALGRPGDVLVGISTSGQSANVIRAVEAARPLGIATIGLLGRDGGRLLQLCDDAVVVPSAVTARIQEAHIFIGHLWCTLIEQHLGSASERAGRRPARGSAATTPPHAPPAREALARRRVLVVGDAMLDRYWFGAVERISPEAPVPVVRINREEERLGGAANVALNVQTLGAACTFLTVVGADEPARRLRELLERQGVATVLGSDPKLHTIVKLRVIGRSQQLLRIDFENQPDHEVLEQLLADFEAALPAHDVVLFSDYGKGGLAHIPRMIERARAAGKPVLVDPKGSDYERYRGATLITPNRAELAAVVGAWSGEADLQARAQALRERLGLQTLLLTRSEEGMSLFDAAGARHFAAEAREVFDVTGAGDTVIATMAALIACGLTADAAAWYANRAGGLVVAKFGTGAVTYEELFG